MARSTDHSHMFCGCAQCGVAHAPPPLKFECQSHGAGGNANENLCNLDGDGQLGRGAPSSSSGKKLL